MWLCVWDAFLVVIDSGVFSIGVQLCGCDAPFTQGAKLLGMRALPRISSGYIVRRRVTSKKPKRLLPFPRVNGVLPTSHTAVTNDSDSTTLWSSSHC